MRVSECIAVVTGGASGAQGTADGDSRIDHGFGPGAQLGLLAFR